MGKIFSRTGDGSIIEQTPAELMQDLEDGTTDAAERGKIPALSTDEVKHIYDIMASPYKFVSVEPGREIVLTYDGCNNKVKRVAVDEDRLQSAKIFEKLLGADTIDIGHVDYSWKPVKTIFHFERTLVEEALMVTHAPLTYGAMPNLGLYSQPDGPMPNPAELLPQGRIDEALASYEATVDLAVEDMVALGGAMYESGVDGINFDTVGAAGDPDFLAALKATRILKQQYPDIKIMLGMAGEFVLGLHGRLTFDGVRLAGLYAHEQVKVAEQAGVDIFGPVCNTNPSESTAWNLSRAITFMKACGEVATVPIHVNMGMGVGAVTLHDHPPIDITSRTSKAMVEICRLDGL